MRTTRRRFLAGAGRLGLAGAAAAVVPGSLIRLARAAGAGGVLSEHRRSVLDAAVARIIPASGPGDWSAADLGAGDYIEGLLAGLDRLYAGGPFREDFAEFRTPSAMKAAGWAAHIAEMRGTYERGLDELDRRAGGDFTVAPPPAQDLILMSLDYDNDRFFRLLYEHTMEGVYGHPVYGGNKGFRAWEDLCYAGDVHGVRRPGAPGDPWHDFGGYSPDEMAEPGDCS